MTDTVGYRRRSASSERSTSDAPHDGVAKARFFAGLGSVVILAVLGSLAAIGVFVGLLPGWQGVSITSGSMQPGIVAGDLVLINDAPALIRRGQVVTFVDPLKGGLTTHRILSMNADGTLTTKGDANVVNDPVAVPFDDVVGAARFIVPFVGYPAYWIATAQVWMLVVLVLATAVMVYLARFAMSSEFDPWREEGP